MPTDISVERAANSRDFDLTVRVSAEEVKEWKESARRNGMSLSQWLSLGLTLASKMALVDGHQRNPAIGRRIDPLLAKAILEAAKGQPWEHRAMLLIGIGAEAEDVKVPTKRSRRIPVDLADLFAEYGIPYRDVAPNYFAVIGEWVLSWQELAMVLTIWRESQFEWCFLSKERLRSLTGMNVRDSSKAIERAVASGIIERQDLGLGKGNGRVSSRSRLVREAGEALLRGDIRPATVDDSFTENYLNTVAKVSRFSDGADVDPLLLQAAREAAAEGNPRSATTVVGRYIAAKEQADQSIT